MFPLVTYPNHIDLAELKKYILPGTELAKANIDIETQSMIYGMSLHVDGESELLEQGSQQHHIRGINLYPHDRESNDFIEYDSMINIRPRDNNRSRFVEDDIIRKQISDIVYKLIVA